MSVLKRIFLSTTTMGVLMFVFLASIGIATFIENSDSTEAAKILVYNASWFEAVLALLAVNLCYNTIRYRMWRWQKIATLIFHLAFIVIITGAGISRYTGEEGVIKVSEFEAVNYMYSAEPFLRITGLNEDGTQSTVEMQKWLASSTQSENAFEIDFPAGQDEEVKFEYKGFVPNSIEKPMEVDGGGLEILEIVIEGNTHFLVDGGILALTSDLYLSFNNDSKTSAVQVTSDMGELYVQAPYDGLSKNMEELSIEDRSNSAGLIMDTLVRDTKHRFRLRHLYNYQGVQLVMRKRHQNSRIELRSSPIKDEGIDALVIEVSSETNSRQLVLKGGKGRQGIPSPFIFNGKQFIASYGSKEVPLPFQVGLKDFRLMTYPGSSSPSSFESDIVLEDSLNGVKLERTILMNHVMDYGGYRMFQSSYDSSLPDGDPNISILSVNKDFWGTWITYCGYLLMAIGFVTSLFFRPSRFRELSRLLRKTRKKKLTLTIAFALISLCCFSQDPNYQPVPEAYAEKAARICVQDINGRIKPLQTLATEVLRKVAKKDSYDEQNAVQVFLGMTFRPDHWQDVPIIWVRNEDVRKKIGVSGSYAAFTDFTTPGEDGRVIIKLEDDHNAAFQTPESSRNAYQKEVIKTFDKLILLTNVFNKNTLKIFPVIGDKNNSWSAGTEPDLAQIKTGIDTLSALQLLVAYEVTMRKGWEEGDWEGAAKLLSQIEEYQREVASQLMPSPDVIEMEISYNKQRTLDKLYRYYFLFGILILLIEIIFIVTSLRNQKVHRWFRILATIAIGSLATWHLYALGARWYISGHAPWSNGYEALTFIGFMSVLAGLIFSKGSRLTIGASALLGGILLMTAHHSNYDPDISNLVPVLKSYWLMIHVAVITGSYGFLGLGAILGFISLLLYIFRGKRNFQRVNLNIDEITFIAEMTITIGLIMAAVGTFLGGVWANESWGRYWGWDAKETWALVIVLWYAIVLHLRFIPGMKGKFLFNVLSMWSYWTVLMTFFGVNYYLSGLHSYAKGEAPPFPLWATLTIIGLTLFTVVAAIMHSRSKKYI